MPSVIPPQTPHYVPAPLTQADCKHSARHLKYYYSIDSTFTIVDYADLPILDLSKSGTLEGRLALANQLKDAMSNYGFFYIINHGYSKTQAHLFNTRLHIFSCLSFSVD